MKTFITIILTFLTLELFAQDEVVGTYSYGNGFNFEYLELTDERIVRQSSFSDFAGSTRSRRIATYQIKQDTVYLTYLNSRHERLNKERIGNFLVIRKTDNLIALIPSDTSNWNQYLVNLRNNFNKSIDELPNDRIPYGVEELGIYMKSR